MKALGLIVEYNPFHNGHLHHLQESKKQTGADMVIAVMSGHFTQRGEPVLVSKWRRAQMALKLGVDLVVELPYVYGVQHSSLFARGAVSILSHLQADFLVFGSESGNISQLQELEALTASPHFQKELKIYLEQGHSVPRAQELALGGSLTAKEPNNTLGLHYLRATKELGANLICQTIPRIHSHYSEQLPGHGTIASATAIRHLLATSQPMADFVPEPVWQELTKGGTIPSWEPYFALLRQSILTKSPEELKKVHDMKEGLEHRFIESARQAKNFEEFMDLVKSKRYTRTRIQRICTHLLTGTSAAFIESLDLSRPVPYVRVLGMNALGRKYLKSLKKALDVPLVSKFSALDHPMLKHEQQVTAAYGAALSPDSWTQLIKDEYARFPIME